MTRYAMIATMLMLAACAPERPDYESVRKCGDLGHQPGTKEYDKCVSQERSIRMMEQQRSDFEEMQKQQEYWRQRGNRY
jgi:hypothetical protein